MRNVGHHGVSATPVPRGLQDRRSRRRAAGGPQGKTADFILDLFTRGEATQVNGPCLSSPPVRKVIFGLIKLPRNFGYICN